MRAMLQHAKPCGAIENIFVEFENTNIVVSHVSEVRIVAQLAAAYYNAILAQNLACDKDVYGNPFTACSFGTSNTCTTDTDTVKTVPSDSNVSCASSPLASTRHMRRRSRQLRHNDQRDDISDKTSRQKDSKWDEEMHGDRLVYDSTFEINEDLVPWLMMPDKWEEKYGFY